MTPVVRLRTLIALLAPALLASACSDRETHRADDPLTTVRVRIATVETVSVPRSIEVRGVVQPARRAFVSSRVTGPVVAVPVRAGALVSRGTPLIGIAPEAIDGQLAQAHGSLAQARASLSLAERNLARYQNLHAERAASDLELDLARAQFEQAQGAVNQAEGAVQSAASIAAESVVRAPFDGRVVDTLVEVGDLASAGRPLVELESRGRQQMWLTVRETDIVRLADGQNLTVRLDARPDLGDVEGSVVEVVPAADPATHSFTVKVDLGALPVATGLSGVAVIPGGVVARQAIPAAAVHRRGGMELVVVRAADGSARTRAITVGAPLGDGLVEVLSGLEDGAAIAIDLPAPVADGTPLEVAP